MIFDQSVRGLAPGAAIDLLGVDIGRVRSVALQYDAQRKRFPVEVVAEIYPLRLGPVRDALLRDASGAGDARRPAAARRQRPARAAAHRQPAHRPALRRARLHPRPGANRVDRRRRHRCACRPRRAR